MVSGELEPKITSCHDGPFSDLGMISTKQEERKTGQATVFSKS
jgi:hypothetical protein